MGWIFRFETGQSAFEWISFTLTSEDLYRIWLQFEPEKRPVRCQICLADGVYHQFNVVEFVCVPKICVVVRTATTIALAEMLNAHSHGLA